MSQQPGAQTVLIVDPDAAVGAALSLLVTQRLGASDIHVGRRLEELPAPNTASRPALILMDWRLLGSAPAQTLETLRTRRPQTFIVVLSLEPTHQAAALAAGADAFLAKTEPPDRVLALLERATLALQ